MNKNGHGEHMEVILREMCKRVEADYDRIDFKHGDWFRLFAWTGEQDKAFQDWLARYLHDSHDARKELWETPARAPMYVCRREAAIFALCHGWRIKD